MFFEQRLIGSMANFGYVLGDPATKAAAVIDPSFDARVLQKAAAENGYAIGLIFNTHHHVDHVFDNERLANESSGKVAAHRLRNVRKDIGLALTGGDVGDDRDRLRSALARHLLGSALPFLASFALLRRALHVQTEDPGRPAAHDDFDDRMPARVAPLVRRDDEPALGERIGVVAGRVFRAAHEPLPVRPVADHQLAVSALFAAADEVLLADRWTVGGDAIARRAPAIRVLDHRRAAFGAVLLRALDDSDLRQGMGVPACGISVAPEEAAASAGSDHREVPFLADVALADVVLFPQRRLDFLPDRLAVRLERLEHLAEHLLGF